MCWGIESLLHAIPDVAGRDPTPRLIGWGVATHSPLSYAGQVAQGLGRNLGETSIGLCLFGWLAWIGRRPSAARQLLLFAGVALAALFALFNLTPIADPLRGRFTLFVALLVVGNGLLALRRRVGGWARWVLLGLLFGLPAANVGKYLVLGRGPAVIDLSDRALEGFLPAHATIGKDHLDQRPRKIGSRVVVSPPRFPWMRHRPKGR